MFILALCKGLGKKFNSNIENLVFAEDFLFAYVLSVPTMCVWCMIWCVNRLAAFLMHWQQEIRYIWMYLNNVRALLHCCWCIFGRLWCRSWRGVCGICGLLIFQQCRCKYTTKQRSNCKSAILNSKFSLLNTKITF